MKPAAERVKMRERGLENGDPERSKRGGEVEQDLLPLLFRIDQQEGNRKRPKTTNY